LLRALARRHAWFAALLLLAALGARGLVPQGYMPEVRAGGALALVPCNGIMPAPQPQPMMHMHHAHAGMHHEQAPASHHPEQPCGFAGLVGPLLLHALLTMPPLPAVGAKLFTVPEGTLWTFARPPLRPPSRGPPHLS
jgi:hypothetical protein